MNKLLIASLIISILVLNIILLPGVEAQANFSLSVRAVDPLGKPLKGIEVYLLKGAEVRKFLTNATGYAEFKHLEEGEYIAEVRLNNVTLARKTVKVPDEREVTLTALLSTVKFRFVNVDNKPVKDLRIVFESSGYANLGKTDANGTIIFDKVPYSTLEGVGVYRLRVSLGSVKVFEKSLEVDQSSIFEQINLPLISLKLTIVNLEGEPIPKVQVKLTSGNFSATKSAENGTVLFENLPSSEIEGVGVYGINATINLGKQRVTIIHEKRELTSTQSLSLIADLAELKVKVIDDEGKPLRGITVMLSNKLAKDFASAETDSKGIAEFENIPLSIGAVKAGTYEIKALRAGSIIGEVEYDLTRSGEIVEIRAARNEVHIKLTDFNNEPLVGYEVSIIDDLTQEEFKTSTNEAGEAVFKLFYGPYELRILKNGKQIYSKFIQVKEDRIELKLEDINFPLMLSIRDAFGRPVKSAKAKITAGEQVLFEGELNGELLLLKLPHPTEIHCDIFDLDGRLIHREVFYADKPSTQDIRLSDYVELGGLIPLETLALAAALSIILILLASGILLLYRRIRAKG